MNSKSSEAGKDSATTSHDAITLTWLEVFEVGREKGWAEGWEAGWEEAAEEFSDSPKATESEDCEMTTVTTKEVETEAATLRGYLLDAEPRRRGHHTQHSLEVIDRSLNGWRYIGEEEVDRGRWEAWHMGYVESPSGNVLGVTYSLPLTENSGDGEPFSEGDSIAILERREVMVIQYKEVARA